MRIISWNIRCIRGATPKRLAQVVDAVARARPDVLLLQEVSVHRDFPVQLADKLRVIGLRSFHFAGASSDMPYGSAIASRYRVKPVVPRSKRSAPWPHLIASGRISAPALEATLFSVHVPNGSKYKWKKVETLEALARMIDPAKPTVVGGDFNEPELVLADGRVASFLAEEDCTAEGTWLGIPRERWQRAVEAVLGPKAPLRHVWLSRNRGVSVTTHVIRRLPRFFDHILVSDHFDIRDANFEHGWRAPGGPSDHSGAWALLRAR